MTIPCVSCSLHASHLPTIKRSRRSSPGRAAGVASQSLLTELVSIPRSDSPAACLRTRSSPRTSVAHVNGKISRDTSMKATALGCTMVTVVTMACIVVPFAGSPRHCDRPATPRGERSACPVTGGLERVYISFTVDDQGDGKGLQVVRQQNQGGGSGSLPQTARQTWQDVVDRPDWQSAGPTAQKGLTLSRSIASHVVMVSPWFISCRHICGYEGF